MKSKIRVQLNLLIRKGVQKYIQHQVRKEKHAWVDTQGRPIPMLNALVLFCMTASAGTPTHNLGVWVCVRRCGLEDNFTPEGSHLSPFLPSSVLFSACLPACRDLLFQFRRDVRPVPPSPHSHSANICKPTHINLISEQGQEDNWDLKIIVKY